MKELTLKSLRKKHGWAHIEYNRNEKVYDCYNTFGRYIFSCSTLERADHDLDCYVNRKSYEPELYGVHYMDL